jgi:hypothetical protein
LNIIFINLFLRSRISETLDSSLDKNVGLKAELFYMVIDEEAVVEESAMQT